MLDRFKIWLDTDPKAKRKLAFWAAAVVVLILVISFFVLVNRSSSSSTTQNLDTQQKQTYSQEVNSSSFESAKNLEKVDNEPVGLADKVFFIPGGKIGFFTKSFKLHIDNQDIAGSPIFLPAQIFSSNDGIIINSETFASAYLKNGQFKNFSSNILQVTPFLVPDDSGLDSVPGFVFLTKNQDKYSINQSTSIDLTKDLKTITSFSPASNFKYVEIRVLNGNIYLLTYENSSGEGGVDIWKLNNTQLQKVQSLTSVKSIIFSDKKILYTTSSIKLPEVTNYDNSIIDFSTNPSGTSTNLDIATKLVQSNILGSVFAKRCGFDISNNLYCLVKEKKVSSSVFQLKDTVVKINLSTNELTFPLTGLVFSGSSIAISNNGTIYIVGQENSILYRFKG